MSQPRNFAGGEGNPLADVPYAGALLRVGAMAALHPVDYAKTLIQIGHEPIAPAQTKTLLTQRPALALPSVFRYIGLIRKRNGFAGLYTGLAPRLAAMGLTQKVEEEFDKYWPPPEEEEERKKERADIDGDEDDEEAALARLIEVMKRDAAKRVVVVMATQPLYVVAVRSMAQFVGGEGKYNGLLSPFKDILKENGILGFWSGWLPRAIGDVLLVTLTSGITFAVNKYLIHDQEMAKYTGHVAGFITSSIVYPFTVVSNTMIVSRSGLAAGYPPHMPFYSGWTDCFRHLSRTNQLKRGSSLFFRYYTGPQVIVGDRVLPVSGSVLNFE